MICKSYLTATTGARAILFSSLVTVSAVALASPAAAEISDTCLLLPGGVISCTDATALIDNTATLNSGPGLALSSATDLIVNLTGNIMTTDDGEIAVLLRSLDDVIFTSDGVITTFGNNADAINIEGRSVAANLNVVRTYGSGSTGVEIIALDGEIRLDADLIETQGDLSNGTLLRGTGDVTLNMRAIRTGGTDAVAIDISTDAAACILLGLGGCDVTVAAEEVTTEGFGGIGALIAATGNTDLNIGVLRTGGDEAAGLDLSSDAAACVILGVGACDTAFTIGELSTEGARSPGALVRGAGDIDANVGFLRTGGDEAVGLDLSSDPQACAILGAGACDTSFSVGELTTSGAGATGILIRAAGDTSGNVGVLRTAGDDAVGIDIAAHPGACVLVGAGACDVELTAGEVATQGDGAAAVIVRTIGNVTTDLGLLSTGGDDSAGLQIQLDPVLCLVVGPGACTVNAAADNVNTDGNNSPGVEVIGGDDPITVVVGDVNTNGNNSPGVDVTGTGRIVVEADNVDTSGNASAGIIVSGGDDPVFVGCSSVTTRGDNSPGVEVRAAGQIDMRCGTITTGGQNSEGILIDGGVGKVTVEVDSIRTAGANSDGINIRTDVGDQVILAGRIDVSGIGSDGIRAISDICGNVTVTAREDIRSLHGTGIFASTDCSLRVTTLPGASVEGQLAGIDAFSGTGATITIGDSITSNAGPAVRVAGAAAEVTILATGSLTGRIELTANDDIFVNNGLFVPVGTSLFGSGRDIIINNGEIRARGTPVLAGCEDFTNRGLINLVNGSATDRLTLCGDFIGEAGSRLAIDVASNVAGTPVDQLIIAGNAAGSTVISLDLLGGPGVVNATGALVVDAATSSATPFTLDRAYRSGFVDYSLQQRGADTFLLALPNELAVETLLLPQIGQTFWYQSADAWGANAALRRDGILADDAGVRLWLQGYGGTERRGGERAIPVFGTTRGTDLRLETDRWGIQGGVDFVTGNHTTMGITGGYQNADTHFASGTAGRIRGYNIGAYTLYAAPNGLHAQLLIKADFFNLNMNNDLVFSATEADGKSYGAEGQVGYRLYTTGRAYVDLNAAVAYVRTEIDGFDASNARFDFDTAESIRGRVGFRAGMQNMAFAPYIDVKLLHEFLGNNKGSFTSGGYILPLLDESWGTSVRGEIGIAGSAGRIGGFLSAWGEIGDTRGYGVRAAIRF